MSSLAVATSTTIDQLVFLNRGLEEASQLFLETTKETHKIGVQIKENPDLRIPGRPLFERALAASTEAKELTEQWRKELGKQTFHYLTVDRGDLAVLAKTLYEDPKDQAKFMARTLATLGPLLLSTGKPN